MKNKTFFFDIARCSVNGLPVYREFGDCKSSVSTHKKISETQCVIYCH